MNELDLFAAAIAVADPAQRAALLDRECAGDPAKRARLEALLRAHARPNSLLDHPAVAPHDPDSANTRTMGGEGSGSGAAGAEVPLGFLTPSARPDSLGRIGHYEVLQVLGQGGFGIVFRAFDEVLHRIVAVKVLSPLMAATSPARKRFLREARSSAAVRHENVVQVHEVGETPLPYLVMEFIPGETLQQRLDRIGPLDVSDILRIGRQIAEGLAAAHATDLIHRDIKPGNVLLEGGQQRVKITDFGLARAADDASISQSGIIAGTPMFMAPEQAKGEHIDHRADLFSLGSVLYQMAAGRPPFRANSTVAVLKRVAEDTPRPIREITPEAPQWLCDIVSKLHAKNPDERFQSAREVVDLLADCEAQLKSNGKVKTSVHVRALKPAARRPEKSGRWKWVAVAVLLLPVLAVAGLEVAGVTHLFRAPQPAPGPVAHAPAPEPTPPPIVVHEPLPPTFKNSIGMEFVIVPKGKAWLGGGKDQPGDKEVEIPADFYLGKYEVTQEEWEKVMGENPSHFSRTGEGKDAVKDIPDADLKRFPVESVSWDQCQIFVAELNQLEKESGWVYRLPTEAEWEYACRGGPMADKADSAFDFYFAGPTNTLLPEQANFNQGLNRSCKVGSYEPNRLGLFDMHGNVWEWCDGKRENRSEHRSGSWGLPNTNCRAANRALRSSEIRTFTVGLRLARVPVGAPSPEAKEPVTDADRRAAEYAVSIGCSVRVNGADTLVKVAANLPRDPFRLTGLHLWNADGNRVVVTDAGLAAFKDCKHLTEIATFDTPLGAAGLAHFKDCKNLTLLSLEYSAVTDAGLAAFKNCKNLTFLRVTFAPVTDAGLVHFKDCKNLNYLYLTGTEVTNAGLAHLTGLDKLIELDLSNTKVTAKGAEGLAKALPKCKITWDGGVIEPTVKADPDRRAAESVLALGGIVRVEGDEREIKAVADLPKIPFRLTYVELGYKPVAASALVAFQACKHLTRLALAGDSVTDEGLAHFKGYTNLVELNMHDNTLVTDAGLAAFKDCKKLMILDLSNAGKVGDAGLAHFKDCKSLQNLTLYGTRVTDAGLAHFKDCTGLLGADLNGLPLTDAGLAHLKNCKNLTGLNLSDTRVTDAGLAHLAGLDKLTELTLVRTKVTAKGVEGLRKALPMCKIIWDGAAIEPKAVAPAADADRKAAEYVLSVGGEIKVNEQGPVIKAAADLPREAFRLTWVGLPNNKQVTDAGFAAFKDCKNLSGLQLEGTPVTDAGLVHLKDCKGLTGLDLSNTKVTDAGLAHLTNCTNLTYLQLADTQTTDAGLLHFKDCKKLMYLNLARTQVGDAGLARLKEFGSLTTLWLEGTPVTDAGLTHLTGLDRLIELRLAKTKVTAKGVEGLAKALPRCKITWDGAIEPK